MSEKKPINASTVARIAGNILSGYPNIGYGPESDKTAAEAAVALARAIVAEVERTESEPSS